MTTKTLTGKYNYGYTFGSVYSTLSLTSSAYIGGQGLILLTAASVINAGHIAGSHGAQGAASFNGGVGSGGETAVTLATGSVLDNVSGGVVTGGAGGGGGNCVRYMSQYPEEGTGGVGGGGASAVKASGAVTLLNHGAIAGGGGGIGGYSYYKGGGGGGGGAALSLGAGSTITNYSTITGGQGGVGGTTQGFSATTSGGGLGGVGGSGVYASTAITLANSGKIAGGAGGQGGNSYNDRYQNYGVSCYGSGGAGGAGVNLAGGGLITNSGTILGGVGGNAAGTNTGGDDDDRLNRPSTSGNGGAGVVLGAGGALINSGIILGNGEGGNGDREGTTGDGVDADGANDTITNSGTILGLVSVKLTAASDRLIVQSGARFLEGAIIGGGGTLEVDGSSKLTGLGGTGTLSVSMSGTFSGFGAYVVDAGVNLTLAGPSTVTAHDTLAVSGQVTNDGALTDVGLTSIAASGQVVSYGALDVTGSLINAGELIGGPVNTIGAAGYAALTQTAGFVNDSGSIIGGSGAAGAAPATGGGGGGAGVVLQGGAFASSAGLINGGQGGGGGNGSPTAGGGGGFGVLLQGGTFTNSGAEILGGEGAEGGTGAIPGGAGGAGGAGAYVTGGLLVNAAGTIAGGQGGAGEGGAANGAAADGVILASFPGGKVINRALITGAAGVYGHAGSTGTVVNYGTLQGTGGASVQFQSAADRLVAEAGSTFIGAVHGGGGTLELGSGKGTIAGLGSTGVFSGAEAMTVSGFGFYQIDAGTSWTLKSGNTLSANQTLTNLGTLSGTLALGGASDRLISEAGSAITGGPVAGNGGTLELTAATGTITGMGKTGTISGGESLTFKGQSAGFGAYVLDAGGAWTFANANTIASGRSLLVDGSATNTGSLAVSGTLTVAGSLTNEGQIATPAAGVILTNNAQLTNAVGATISGPLGVYGNHYNAITVTNFGTIIGSSGNSVTLRNVNDRLVVEAGAVFDGAVAAYRGTLELAMATGTLTGLGTTLSASDAVGDFSGFEVYELDSGGVWTLAGANSLSTGVHIDAGATLTNTGSLYLGGLISNFGSFINQGTVNAGSASGTELYIGGSGQLTNDAGADLIGWIGLATSGVYPVTVINAGTIDGTGGVAVHLESSKDRLILQSGASFIGQVQGGGATLEIPFGGGTVTGLGSAMTLSGMGGTFSGFGVYVIDTGVTLTAAGNNQLASRQTLTDNGELINTGDFSGYQGAGGSSGFSGGGGSGGGAALSLAAGAVLSNASGGVVAGGGGGGGGNCNQYIYKNPEEGSGGGGGGGGGAVNASGAITVLNHGTIAGGGGGTGGYSIYLAGAGGGGGTALTLGAGSTITNFNTINGGGGGLGGTTQGFDSIDSRGGTGGGGGTGVSASGAISLTNSGRIAGGGGGAGGYSDNSGAESGVSCYGSGGGGGAGVNLAGGGSITNSGTIQGGSGGNAGGPNIGSNPGNQPTTAGNGGAGVVLGASSTLTNSGFIGGGGGGGDADHNGSAADGVDANGANDTIATSGTISGADSVRLSNASDRLIVEAKAKFIGAVAGGGGTLELATGSETITGLGATGTLSGAASGNFSGFGTYSVDLGATLTLTGADSAGTHTLAIGGSLINAGTLTASSAAVTLIGAGQLTNKAGDRIQAAIGVFAGAGTTATVTNAGTIQGSSAAVQFQSSGDVLVTQSGAVFIGAIQGGGGTLAVGGGTDTITGLGGAGTLSGAASGNFSGFSTYAVNSGGTLVLGGAQTLASGQTIADSGTVRDTGTLTDNGMVSVARSGIVTETGALIVTGSLVNAGRMTGAVGASSSGMPIGGAGQAGATQTAGAAADSGTIAGGAGGAGAAGGGAGGHGGVGGAGVVLNGGVLTSAIGGTVMGGAGGAGGYASGGSASAGGVGGAGVIVAGGTLSTQAGGYIGQTGGLIVGGQGGAAQTGSTAAAGAGGAGAYLSSGAIDNYGTIQGGQGGSGGAGAAGGDGVVLKGGSIVNASGAVINGEIGLYGVAGSTATFSNAGLVYGSSGVAVELKSASDRFIDLAVPGGPITGGLLAGKYFQGIVLGGGGTLELSGGSGRIGGLGGEYSGFGGYTIDAGGSWTFYYSNTIASGHTLTNAGTLDLIGSLANQGSIVGAGAGVDLANYQTYAGYGILTNGSLTNPAASITGAVGVYGLSGSVGTVTNFGTIDGTSGVAVRFASAGDRLVAEAGAKFIGTAQGGGGTLEFATGGGTISGLGGAGTLSGPTSLSFSGFGTYVLDADATWSVTGSSLGPNLTIANYGTLLSALTLGSASDRVIAGGGAVFSGKLAGGGGTLELAAGVGTVALGGSKISGFGTYQIDAGGSWTLTGSANIGAAGVNVAGALALAGTLSTGGAINGAGGVNGLNHVPPTTYDSNGVQALSVLAGARLTNTGSISGGAGGHGYGSGNIGEIGGAGALGVGVASASVINSGRVAGGAGGAGGAGYYEIGYGGRGGMGGAGGVGVSLTAASLTNSGVIAGGAGGAGGLSVAYYIGGNGGAGGLGIVLAGGHVTNTGTILGGAGGAAGADTRHWINGYGVAGSAAYAISVSGGGTIVNGAANAKKALISGLIGVVDGGGGAVTVTNFGTIKGTGGTSVRFASASDRLIAEAGSHFVGAVQGGGGVLELAGAGAETITALGGAATISGALSASVSGFASFAVDTGNALTVAGSAQVDQIATLADYGAMTLAAGQTLQASGLILVGGSLNVAGVVDGPPGSGQANGAGLGVVLLAGGQITVSGAISGGQGQSNVAALYGAGGAGGSGVSGAGAGTVSVNGGAITGAGGGMGYYGNGPGAGGAGGAGASLGSGSVTLNGGSIAGGAGGGGTRYYDVGGSGGAGGDGVSVAGAGMVTNAGGTIRGGTGGAGGLAGYYGGSGGAGGAGVAIYGVGTVINGAGAIIGGAGGGAGYGGLRSGSAGAGGDGVLLAGGGAVVNGSAGAPTALIEGFVGVYAGGAGAVTVTNYGTIDGTGGVAVALGSAGDLLRVEAGSVFLGAVMGDEATLDLASGVGTISSLAGGDVTVSGSMPTTTFNNFGTLEIGAGAAFTLTGTGAIIPDAVAGLTDAGVLTVDENLTFSGVFTEAAGAMLAVATTDKLTLTGATSLSGAINGAGTVKVSNATISGLTIGGTAVLSDAGAVIQTGTLTIGDTTAKAAQLVIAVGATYTIENDAAIDRGHAATSSIRNSGTLIATGTGVTLVAVKTVDTGSIVAADGVLEFNKAMTGTGSMAVDAGATLELTSSAVSTLSMTFNGADSTLALKDPSKFAATIAGFAPGDTIDLVDKKATSAVLGAGDTLVITNGKAAVATLHLSGTYTGDTFTTASDGKGGTDITVSTGAGPAPPAASPTVSPLPFIAAMAGLGATAGAAHVTATHAEAWRPILMAPGAHAA